MQEHKALKYRDYRDKLYVIIGTETFDDTHPYSHSMYIHVYLNISLDIVGGCQETSDSIFMFCWGITIAVGGLFATPVPPCFLRKGQRTLYCCFLVLELVKDLSVGSCKTVEPEGLLVLRWSFCL